MGPKRSKKRDKIVEAFLQSVVESGLASSSMAEVASRVGIDRSSLYHYFKSREELIDALTEFVVEHYIASFNSKLSTIVNGPERAHQLVEHLFGGFHQPKLSRVFDELCTAGHQEKHIAVQVKMIYMAIETAILKEIDLGFPDASPEKRQMIGYALCQLAEGSSVMASLGFNVSRMMAGKEAALHLLRVLESE
ncbi:TetR/AcrR family transcriptional regulator [Pseudomonas monteilii]|uniref:TetR/AcrR family transcriptional regulator n=1 Tax=Pseudomonas monteilii TaxID=76759 RepID=UPI00383AB173